MQHVYDIIIIGGGPIGLACALEAKKHSLSYMILEKGCLVNSLYRYPTNMTFFSTSDRLEIGEVPFVSNNVKPTRPEALEYYRRIATSNRVNIHLNERVIAVKRVDGSFTVQSEKRSYSCSRVIVATGFYDIPVMMNIEGEDLPKVTHYYKDPHFYAMQKVVVIGANNSAVDAALETYRKGAEVTVVTRGPEIGKRVKYWVRPDIENRIKEQSIAAYFNSTLCSIRESEVDIVTPEGTITIENDYVIAMTGYQPDFRFLQTIGIELSTDAVMQPSYNSETMESNVEGIYLAGVVCGGMNTHVWFIENSREHAKVILSHIMQTSVRPVSGY
jgi:thioredoxin reductase (NADPH)